MAEKTETRGRRPKYEAYSDAAKIYRLKLKAEGMVAITAYVPEPVKEILKKLAKETGRTQGEVLSHLLNFAEDKREEFLSSFEKDS